MSTSLFAVWCRRSCFDRLFELGARSVRVRMAPAALVFRSPSAGIGARAHAASRGNTLGLRRWRTHRAGASALSTAEIEGWTWPMLDKSATAALFGTH